MTSRLLALVLLLHAFLGCGPPREEDERVQVVVERGPITPCVAPGQPFAFRMRASLETYECGCEQVSTTWFGVKRCMSEYDRGGGTNETICKKTDDEAIDFERISLASAVSCNIEVRISEVDPSVADVTARCDEPVVGPLSIPLVVVTEEGGAFTSTSVFVTEDGRCP